MKNVTKFGLTTLACLMLAACGSSGGGSSSSDVSAKDTTTIKPPTNNSNTQTTNNGTSLTADSKTGNVLVLKDQDDNLTTSYAPQTNSSLTEIIVEGKKIPTAFPGIYSGGWSSIGQLEVCCGKYSYVRFGVAEGGVINDQAIDSYVFYNGNTTKDMPTSGSANYKGDLILTAEHPAFDDVDWKTGKSDFHADFGTKQLEGNFHIEGLSAISVNAKIEGNGFSGTATSSELGQAAQLEGKFYGPKAQELSGLFEEKATRPSWGGAFGAKQ